MPKLTDQTELTSLSDSDLAHVVDVSDTTSSAAGTSKKITYTNIFARFLAAARTMTGTLTMSGAAINEADYVTVASATTCDIGAAASNNVAISGTTTITSFGTANAGITRRCRATGAFLITYNATSLITANGKNITTRADDCFTMTSLGSGNWIMTSFKPSDGRVLAGPINAQTGTTYTLAMTDQGGLVTLSNASAITLTVPTNASVALPIGSQIDIAQTGAGKVTVAAAGGVTVNSLNSVLGLAGQYAAATLKKTGTDTWLLMGAIVA